MLALISHSPDQTRALGRCWGALLPPRTIIGLDGDLGAGKTWLCKGLVEGIGDFDAASVKSPAYNLVHEYPVEKSDGQRQLVIHIDFYRLEALSDTDALLFAEYFEHPSAIVLVEWASRCLDKLAPAFLSVQLSAGPVQAGPVQADTVQADTVQADTVQADRVQTSAEDAQQRRIRVESVDARKGSGARREAVDYGALLKDMKAKCTP